MLTRLAAICTASLGLAIGTSATAQAADAAAPPVNITWGGYVKLDLLLSRFSDAPVPQGTGRDFYVPNAIPVAAAGSEHARSYLDFHAKETRLFVRADGEFGGEKITAYVETDFISNQGTLGS